MFPKIGSANKGSYDVRPSDELLLGPPRRPGTVVWWSGGLAVIMIFSCEWWSGGLVVWWSGGLVIWWSGLHRSAAKRRVAEKICITKLHRSNAKRRVAEKLCVAKILCHKNFVSQELNITNCFYHIQLNFWGLRLGIIWMQAIPKKHFAKT